MSKITHKQEARSWRVAASAGGLICAVLFVGFAATCVPTQVGAQERDTAAEAVTNLKAYAAFKMGHHDEARRVWEELAKKGNTTALLNLANMFQQAQGVDEDQKKALTYVRKGAELGDTRAQYELGMAYERGTILERDLQQAALWFEKAAEQGEMDAQFALGVLNATAFGKGLETATDEQRKQAVAWLSKASAQGHEEAKTYLDLIGNTQKPM
jgi:TPR repeat protein